MELLREHESISSVLLVGGTHGNELTGIHLVQHWKKQKIENKFNHFRLDYLIANLSAIDANKRYIDHDLNRCFKLLDLEDHSLKSNEQLRAKQINNKFGPKGNSKVDFIIDLHTSTTNMQTNIVLTRIDAFHLQLAAYLKQRLPNVVITSESELMEDHHFLESIAGKGVLIEVGPIPQGSVEYPCFETTEKTVLTCLEFIEMSKQHTIDDLPDELEIMSYHSKIYFPTDEIGNITASVHPDLVGKAYPQLVRGDRLFKSFDGGDVFYQGDDTYCAFINEAAYYDQKIAMCLCRSKKYSLSSCKVIDFK